MKILEDGDSLEEFRSFLSDHTHQGKLDLDGFFCVTDRLAYQIIRMLKDMGVRVPEEAQVIGYDGARILGEEDYLCSTIVQPTREIAQMCVELLLQEAMAVRPPLVCLPVSYAYGGTTKEG